MPNTVVATGAASDVQVVPGMVVFGGAGGRSNEGRLQLDGISVGSAFNGGGVSAYIADVGNAQEVALTSSGGLGEAEVGGPSMNVVPKTGGNTVKGSVYLSGVTKGMIGSNYTDDLKARGLSTPGSSTKVWDFNGAVGGPIKKDRLWFFYTLRDEGNHKTVPGMFANLNAGDPTKWTYAPDLNRPAVQAASFRTTSLRLTAQATPRNQVRVFWDEQMPCEGAAWPGSTAPACRQSGDNEIIAGGTAAPTPAASATAAPETASYRNYGTRFRQVSWQSPMTSRLLARSERRQLREPVSRQDDARQSRLRLHSGHGTVRRRVRRPTTTRAGLVYRARNLCTGLGLAGVEQLARLAVVRRGQALDEIRLSGRIPDARQLPLHEQPVHDLPHE